jgi:hypothetical protein
MGRILRAPDSGVNDIVEGISFEQGVALKLTRHLGLRGAFMAASSEHILALITVPATWPLSFLRFGSPWWTQRRWG